MNSLPLQAPSALLRVDGVRHDLGEATVLRPAQREAFPATLPWSIELGGSAAARFRRAVPDLASGRPTPPHMASLLDLLGHILVRSGRVRPEFVLCTIDRVEVGPDRVWLTGTCALLLLTKISKHEAYS